MASKCIYPNRSINSYLAESSSQIIELIGQSSPSIITQKYLNKCILCMLNDILQNK